MLDKELIKKEIDKLPEDILAEVLYEFYVKKKLAATLKAAEEGHVVSHEEGKKRLLPK